MPQPRVAAVILNWKDADATTACLAALATSDYSNISPIVVDNASDNGSAERFAAMPNVELIRNNKNLGFTGGANTGIRHAMASGADFVWLLNSDAVVMPDTLTRLLATAGTDPMIGLISPVFTDPATPDITDFCAGRFDPLSRTMETASDAEMARQWQRDTPDRIILVGTALLIRRGLIEAIGGLDDQYFAYVEDVDYSLRSLEAGFRNVVDLAAVVYHPSKSTVNNPAQFAPHLHYYMARNYPLLWRKRYGFSLFTKPMVWHVNQCLIMIERLGQDNDGITALKAGLWDGVRNRGGPFDPTRQMPSAAGWALRACGAILRRGSE